MWNGILWIVIAIGLSGIGWASEERAPEACSVIPANVSQKNPKKQGFLASISGKEIDESDLPDHLKQKLYEVDLHVYDARRAVFEEYVLYMHFMDLVNKSQGKKTLQVVQGELLQVGDPTEKDKKAWYEQHKDRLSSVPYERIAPQIAMALKQEQMKQKKEELVAELLKQKKAEFLPSPPVALQFDIAVDGMPIKGSAKSKVEIVKFSDFRCGACKSASDELKRLLADFPSDVSLVYMPISILGEPSEQLAEASLCAHKQEKFWEFHDEVFATSSLDSPDVIVNIAQKLKLDMKKFQLCISKGDVKKQLQMVRSEFDRLGLSATPGVYVNGKKTPRWMYADLKSKISDILSVKK